jgi:hypothetical protein
VDRSVRRLSSAPTDAAAAFSLPIVLRLRPFATR